MKKPKKAPVKAKGGAAGGSGAPTGKRGTGPGKARGIKVHHKGIVPHHPVHHPGLKGGGSAGGSSGPVAKKPKPAKKPKVRQWSPGWDTDCCVAEAVGRILGLSDSQVLELDAAADRTIAGVLEVADVPGFPVWRVLADSPLCQAGSDASDGASFGGLFPCRGQQSGSVPRPGDSYPLILGVQLEEPHAVAVLDGVWWSWGEPFNPDDWPELVIEEVWSCAG